MSYNGDRFSILKPLKNQAELTNVSLLAYDKQHANFNTAAHRKANISTLVKSRVKR